MTDRIPLGDLTADDLAQLYDRVAELEKDAAITQEVMKNADEDMDGARETARWFKAQAEQAQAWGGQHRDRANRYRARADAVKAECDALNSETKGLNPFAMAGRRDAVARIRAALQSISYDTPVPDDPRVTELEQQLADVDGEPHTDREHGITAGVTRVLDALDEQQPTRGRPVTDTQPADDAPERTREQRLAELAEKLCRSYTYGVGLEELQKTDPEEAGAHRDAAEHLLPWIDEAPKREIREAFGRGYDKGRDRSRASQARRVEKAERAVNLLAEGYRAAEAAIESVKALHREWKRNETDPGPGYCAHCEKDGDLIRWPCPTFQALNRAELPKATEFR